MSKGDTTVLGVADYTGGLGVVLGRSERLNKQINH